MRTTVLLPVDLHATLKEIADRDRRSLHREIIYALERFAAEQGERPVADLQRTSALQRATDAGDDIRRTGPLARAQPQEQP